MEQTIGQIGGVRYYKNNPSPVSNVSVNPVAIIPYTVISGSLSLTTTNQVVYSINVPYNIYISSVTIIPSSSNVRFYLNLGAYTIGSNNNSNSISEAISIEWPAPYFPVVYISQTISLWAYSSSATDTIQLAILGMEVFK